MPLPRIAIATGDPAGIGPEIALKAALDARVRSLCRPLLVGDPAAVELHARARPAYRPAFTSLEKASDAQWTDGAVNLLDARDGSNVPVKIGTVDAAYGRASLASASRAIKAALAGDVEAVVAAPQTERSIAAAGHCLRRLSIVRRARDRHAGQRRLSDDLLRPVPHRARDLARERARSGRVDHA